MTLGPGSTAAGLGFLGYAVLLELPWTVKEGGSRIMGQNGVGRSMIVSLYDVVTSLCTTDAAASAHVQPIL